MTLCMLYLLVTVLNINTVKYNDLLNKTDDKVYVEQILESSPLESIDNISTI